MTEPATGPRDERHLLLALGCLTQFRLLYPFFNSPLAHLFSDPARHWSNAGRFLAPDMMGAGDPLLYQLWLYAVRTLSADDPAAVNLSCGVLCASMPLGWYLAMRELLPRRQALIAALAIGIVPGFLGIYAYFMTETLLLTLSGFAFWLTFRAWRRPSLGIWTMACVVWTSMIFTRMIALPMAVLAMTPVWAARNRRLEKVVIAGVVFLTYAVPAAMHAYPTLGFIAPLGNPYPTSIYERSGKHDIEIEAGAGGHWRFGSPSFYNPTFYPFSDWTTDRRGTVTATIDLAHGRADWIAESARADAGSVFGWWRQFEENVLYIVCAQSWPDNDPASLIGRLTVWTRWMWPPLMVFVAVGVARQRFHGKAWLLPACGLGMLLLLAVQRTSIIEGRYVKPVHPILLAAALVLWAT